MSIDVAKLRLIRNTVDTMLQFESSADINLVLHEAGASEIMPEYWEGITDWRGDGSEPTLEDRKNRATDTLRDLTASTISDIATALQQVFETGTVIADDPEPAPLMLFASHLVTQAGFVSLVSADLQRWGIDMFVAHESIEPDTEWHTAIEENLQAAHAGVVFLKPGFLDSRWCDQEVGWMLGRGIPVYPMKFGQDPYGPLGKKQAKFVPETATALQVASFVLDWVATKPALSRHLTSSYVRALSASGSYRMSDIVLEKLLQCIDLTDRQVAGTAAAVRDNNQVFGGRKPAYIIEFLMGQPGFASNEELLREVAAVRGGIELFPATAVSPVDNPEQSLAYSTETPF